MDGYEPKRGEQYEHDQQRSSLSNSMLNPVLRIPTELRLHILLRGSLLTTDAAAPPEIFILNVDGCVALRLP